MMALLEGFESCCPIASSVPRDDERWLSETIKEVARAGPIQIHSASQTTVNGVRCFCRSKTPPEQAHVCRGGRCMR